MTYKWNVYGDKKDAEKDEDKNLYLGQVETNYEIKDDAEAEASRQFGSMYDNIIVFRV